MIARIWRGEVPTHKADEYFQLMQDVALPDYRGTPGNLGAYALRRSRPPDPADGSADGSTDDVTEITMLSLWDSLDSITAFAGEEPDLAKYYDFDDDFLLSKASHVEHHTAAAADAAAPPVD